MLPLRASLLSPLTSVSQLVISSLEDFFFASVHFVVRGDVTNGVVQSDLVVMLHELCHQPACVFQRERRSWPDAIGFDCAMEAFQLSVALGIIRTRSHMGHTADADELFEVFGDELWAVIGDDPRTLLGMLFLGPLQYDLHVRLRHRLADLPVHDGAAVSVQDTAQVIKRASDVHITDVGVPMSMGSRRLVEPFAFATGLGCTAADQTAFFQDAIDTGRTGRHHVGVQHHVGQPSIALQWILVVKANDCRTFFDGQPMISWNPAVVLVDLTVALLPVVELSGLDADPANDMLGGNLGFVLPVAYVIDDDVADFVGNPASV